MRLGSLIPQNDPISSSDLSQYDGSDPSKPIYVAIKGKVFDVTPKREMYGPGAGYNIFAGKDASKGLGKLIFSSMTVVEKMSKCGGRCAEKERLGICETRELSLMTRNVLPGP